MSWGRRKDNNQPYKKTGRKGISSSRVATNPLQDVHFHSKVPDASYKETKGFLYQNGLVVDVYDSKSKKDNEVNPEFLAEIRTAWNESPIETRNLVKRIVVKKVSSDNYGWEARWKQSTRTLTFINLPSSDMEAVSGLVRHELDHVWYTHRQANDDPEVLEYQKKIDTIEPVTNYAKEFYDYWKEDERIHRKNAEFQKTHEDVRKQSLRRIQYDRNEYYNEQHSETGYLMDLYLKGYTGIINDVDSNNLAKAIKFYLELHPDIKESVVSQARMIESNP